MKVRKLFLSVFAVTATAITATATTYAWFRIGSSGYVNNLDFQVITGLGFKVAVDGTNSAFYTDTLTPSQIESAILRKHNPNKYVFFNGELYEKTELEDNKTKYRLIEDKEKYKLILDEIKLKDLSTMKVADDGKFNFDGFKLYNQSGDEITDNSHFLEFDLYFKTESEKKSDQKHFGIYLCDDTSYELYSYTGADGTVHRVSEEMQPTAIKSDTQEVKLNRTLSYLNSNFELVKKYSTDTVNVNIANAMRISKRDNGEIAIKSKSVVGKDYPLDNDKSFIENSDVVFEQADQKAVDYSKTDTDAKIYELSNKDNLGSYATNYDGDNDELNRLYNSKYNAMWTYLESAEAIPEDLVPLDYDALMELYNGDSEGKKEKKIYNSLSDKYILTELHSGLKAHKVTFRIWIEGYDADYFDGVSGLDNIKCNLSFKVNSQLHFNE